MWTSGWKKRESVPRESLIRLPNGTLRSFLNSEMMRCFLGSTLRKSSTNGKPLRDSNAWRKRSRKRKRRLRRRRRSPMAKPPCPLTIPSNSCALDSLNDALYYIMKKTPTMVSTYEILLVLFTKTSAFQRGLGTQCLVQ